MQTAEQQASEAFDREWRHAVGQLPAQPPPLSEHAAVLQCRRCTASIEELLQHYSSKLPAYLYGPRLLSAAQQLQARGQHQLAADACYARLQQLQLPSAPLAACRRLDSATRLSLHVQALFGLHSCQAAVALRADPAVQHAHTAAAVQAALAGLQAACSLAMPGAPELVHAGTRHLHSAASALMAAGHHAQALPCCVFAAQAMECDIALSTTDHLPWRVQLYASAAECFFATTSGSSSSSSEAVHAFIAAGLAQLDKLAAAHALDAVPAPDVSAAIQAAQARLRLLQAVLFPLQDAAAGGSEALRALLQPLGDAQGQLAALARVMQIRLCARASPLEQSPPPDQQLSAALDIASQLAHAVFSAGDSSRTVGASSDEKHALHQVSSRWLW
jgi:hypothetical protein